MTRTEFKVLVRANLGGRTDKDSIIEAALNLALDELNKEHGWKVNRQETDLAIVLDDLYVTLPANFSFGREARLIDGLTLSESICVKLKECVVSKHPSISDEPVGRPNLGYIEGGKLYFTPPSDGSYSIRLSYTAKFTQTTSDSDTLPSGLEFALIAWTSAYVYQCLGSSIQYSNWMARYGDAVRKAIRADNRNPITETQMEGVQDRQSYGSSSTPWLDPFVRG